MNNNFYKYVKDFFENYLPNVKFSSSNTIATYKYSFVILLRYFDVKQNIKSNQITLDSFNEQLIDDYKKWLRDENKSSAKTINIRITALKVFFEYVSKRELNYSGFYNYLKSMKSLKSNTEIIEYLSDEEIKILLSIKIKTNIDLKHLTILYLLYDSAIRVQELCDLTYKDINFKEKYLIIKNGKGNKSRTIPLTQELINFLFNYCKLFDCENQIYLFENQSSQKYTRWGIQYIIDKYIKAAKEEHPDLFNIKVTPHTFRHSKAMSLLNHDVSLNAIEKLLGHNSISTTEIYARVNSKNVRDALESNKIDIKTKKRISNKKEEDLENWLKKSGI